MANAVTTGYCYDPETLEDYELEVFGYVEVEEAPRYRGRPENCDPGSAAHVEFESIRLRAFGRTYEIDESEARRFGFDSEEAKACLYNQVANYEPDYESDRDFD